MARIPTTQDKVLLAVIDRLISQIDQLRPANTFLTLNPEPPDLRLNHPLICTVSPMGGDFDDAVLTGAGADGLFEYSGVIIGVWSSMKLDQSGHAAQVLTESTRGLLVLKRAVLKALTAHDLTDSDGNQLLVNLMAPKQAQHPREMNPDRLTGFTLYFSTDFEWDLSDA